MLQRADAQETNSYIAGRIFNFNKEPLIAATVTAIHEPTKNIYSTQSRDGGLFNFFNLRPGGPYTIIVSYTGYNVAKKENIFLNLDQSGLTSDAFDFFLDPIQKIMPAINISAGRPEEFKSGIQTSISNHMLQAIPSISRNLQDYLRVVPQAKVYAEGSFSFSGQSTRFNTFYVDGAANNDLQGLAQTGTNGGLTGSSPIAIDAIEEIKVMLAPYDVQFGNFTGGTVNAVTRSGTNELKASGWYYFRNEKLAGRSPIPLENPGLPGTLGYPRLSHFLNQTYGIRVGGPLIKNKLFYFLLAEKQSEVRPQQFDIKTYQGNSGQQDLNALAGRLRNVFGYDPGSFLESNDKLNVTRIMGKVDWNTSVKNKFTFSWRYNLAERTAAATSGANIINFSNDIFFLPTTTHSGTLEWKCFPAPAISNRLLFTITHESDDRTWQGSPFPRVTINDGNGFLRFGSGTSTMLSIFKATEYSFSDIIRLVKKKHNLSAGLEFNLGKINDTVIPNFFGSYTFRSLGDFMNNSAPIKLQRSFSLLDEPKGDNTIAGAQFKSIRASIFLNDEIRLNQSFKVNLGVRLDRNSLPTHPFEDKYFNDTARKVISIYYDLENARSGRAMDPVLQVAPRLGFSYTPMPGLVINGGAGFFTGRIPNAWSSVLHQNNGVSVGSYNISSPQYTLTFNPDPYRQPGPQAFGINPSNAKGELDIISKKFKYPSIFRTSLSIEKTLDQKLAFTLEALATKNINETKYTNVNILPPLDTTAAPDSRSVYSFSNAPRKIPLPSQNPYTQIFLLTNNHGKKGSAYNLSFTVHKKFNKGLYLNAGYSFGKSTVLFETASGVGMYNSQWSSTETVNGKNNAVLSRSDVDGGHRIFCVLSKKIRYGNDKLSTTVTLMYDGQSGAHYSYVYNGSIINDNGSSENYDLIYIPTSADFNNMTFVDILNSNGQVRYSAQQQKDLLNAFIGQDKYLKKHRGEFAERNGARLPFTHLIDLHMQQEVIIRLKNKSTGFELLLDIFNVANLLNRKWGRVYSMVNDNYSLINFSGTSGSPPVIRYQYNPVKGTPYSVESGSLPGSSPRWISQLGFRINLN
jgi:hypothetical protein